MIIIQLNKQDFEYDLHSLVKSFYPGEDVTVCYEEPENAGEALLKISVIYKEQEIEIRFEKDGQTVYLQYIRTDRLCKAMGQSGQGAAPENPAEKTPGRTEAGEGI